MTFIPCPACAAQQGPTTFHARFEVRGIPKAQPRARAFSVVVKGKPSARMYDAGTAEAWKADVIRAGEAKRPAEPLTGPVRVDIDFLLPRPKRLMRKRDPDGELPATGKPDRDNLDKAVLDALKTDGWFLDDAQVWAGEPRKWYHAKTGHPGAIVAVMTYGETP